MRASRPEVVPAGASLSSPAGSTEKVDVDFIGGITYELSERCRVSVCALYLVRDTGLHGS